MVRNHRIVLFLIAVLVASMACSIVEGVLGDEEEKEAPKGETETNVTETLEGGILAAPEDKDETEAGTTIQEDLEEALSEQDDQVPENENVPEENDVLDSIFPLPDDASNLITLGADSINFQTSLSIVEAVAFYRQAFGAENLTERTINTEISETTFSMVFDGHSKGTIVIQGVDLGDSTTNINIRFEDV